MLIFDMKLSFQHYFGSSNTEIADDDQNVSALYDQWTIQHLTNLCKELAMMEERLLNLDRTGG